MMTIKSCPKCGHTYDQRSALVELGKVVARMNQVSAEIQTCSDNDRWWALQDEFTELMRRSDALWEAS